VLRQPRLELAIQRLRTLTSEACPLLARDTSLSLLAPLASFIGGVFFYLYNRTILSMSQYHQKVVIIQNVGLALKTAETLPDTKMADAREKIIEQLTKDVNAYLLVALLPAQEPASSRTTKRQRALKRGLRADAPVNDENPAVSNANR
jgi:S-methylmethionine-dependent homocysteine/selenocysteine methylase